MNKLSKWRSPKINCDGRNLISRQRLLVKRVFHVPSDSHQQTIEFRLFAFYRTEGTRRKMFHNPGLLLRRNLTYAAASVSIEMPGPFQKKTIENSDQAARIRVATSDRHHLAGINIKFSSTPLVFH